MKNKIVILGTGGHAKVVLQELLNQNLYSLEGFINTIEEKTFEGFPVLGSDDDLENIFNGGVKTVFIAIGNNSIRKKLIEQCKNIGFSLGTIISPNANIGRGVQIAEGTVIMSGVSINASTQIGEGCIINTNSSVDHDCIISNYSHIAPGSHLAGNIHIGEGSFLGIGVSVIPEQHIGKWCTIGAGSVVINTIADNSKVVGVPASRYL